MTHESARCRALGGGHHVCQADSRLDSRSAVADLARDLLAPRDRRVRPHWNLPGPVLPAARALAGVAVLVEIRDPAEGGQARGAVPRRRLRFATALSPGQGR